MHLALIVPFNQSTVYPRLYHVKHEMVLQGISHANDMVLSCIVAKNLLPFYFHLGQKVTPVIYVEQEKSERK